MAGKKKFEKRKEKAEKMLREGVAAIAADPDDMLRRYLAFRSRFHQYSFRNQMLIFLQKEDARHVMGYSSWQKNGRQVKRGETGLLIFRPYMKTAKTQEAAEEHGVELGEKYLAGFGTAKVFDFSQTKPITEAMKEDLVATFRRKGYSKQKIQGVQTAKEAGTETVPQAIPELQGASHAHLFRLAKAAMETDGYAIEELPETASQRGDCNPEEKTVRIRKGMSPNQSAKTAVHEYAHSYAHDRGTRRELGRRRVELQAEGAAFMTCFMMGLDTSEYSFRYMANWSPADLDDEEDLVATVEQEISAIEEISDYITRRMIEAQEARGEERSGETTSMPANINRRSDEKPRRRQAAKNYAAKVSALVESAAGESALDEPAASRSRKQEEVVGAV